MDSDLYRSLISGVKDSVDIWHKLDSSMSNLLNEYIGQMSYRERCVQ